MKKRTVFAIFATILIAVMAFSFVGCEQKIGSGSADDALAILNKGFETADAYETFYWNSTLKQKNAEFKDAKGKPVYETTSYNVQYAPSAKEPRAYFSTNEESFVAKDGGYGVNSVFTEYWWGGYYENEEVKKQATTDAGKENTALKKEMLIIKSTFKEEGRKEDEQKADCFPLSKESLFGGAMARFNIKTPLAIYKSLLNDNEVEIVSAFKAGVVNTIVVKFKDEIKNAMYGNIEFTVLDIKDENGKQTTMLSSITNDYDKDSDYRKTNVELENYFTYNFLNAGAKIGAATSDSAAKFVDSINNPEEKEKDLTIPIIIGAAVVVVLILIAAFFIWKNKRKKKHAEYMARKAAETEEGVCESEISETETQTESAAQVNEADAVEDAKPEKAPKPRKAKEKAPEVAEEAVAEAATEDKSAEEVTGSVPEVVSENEPETAAEAETKKDDDK